MDRAQRIEQTEQTEEPEHQRDDDHDIEDLLHLRVDDRDVGIHGPQQYADGDNHENYGQDRHANSR